jgi:mRNA interferase MazF
MGVVKIPVRRGEVWLACLDPTQGAEIKKTRPCLVVSPPEIHDFLRTALIVPMTSKGFPAPFRIPIDFSGKAGLLLLDQIRVVDKSRLVKRLGAVEDSVLQTTLDTLQELFAG